MLSSHNIRSAKIPALSAFPIAVKYYPFAFFSMNIKTPVLFGRKAIYRIISSLTLTPPHSLYQHPRQVEELGLKIIIEGEQSLSPCQLWTMESVPYAMPGQHTSASPEGAPCTQD